MSIANAASVLPANGVKGHLGVSRNLNSWDPFRPALLPEGYNATSSPSIVHSSTEYIDIFFRGGEYDLLHAKMNSTGDIFEIQSLGELLLTAPSAVSSRRGSIDVAIVSMNRSNPMVTSFRNGNWTGFVDLGGSTEYTPAISAPSPEELDVFVSGVDNSLFQRRFRDGEWGSWTFLTRRMTGAPFALSVSRHSSLVFMRNGTKIMKYAEFPGDGTWRTVGSGHHLYSTACVSKLPRGAISVFARNRVGTMSTFDGHNNVWMDVRTPTITVTTGAPACAYSRCHTDVIVMFKNTFYLGKIWH